MTEFYSNTFHAKQAADYGINGKKNKNRPVLNEISNHRRLDKLFRKKLFEERREFPLVVHSKSSR